MNCANHTIQKLFKLTVGLIRYGKGRVVERYKGSEERVPVSRSENQEGGRAIRCSFSGNARLCLLCIWERDDEMESGSEMRLNDVESNDNNDNDADEQQGWKCV